MATQTQKFPFFDTDFTKLMGDVKIPAFDLDQVMATQRRNFEALTEANQLTLEGVQNVVSRQSELIQNFITESNELFTNIKTEGTAEEKLAEQADLLRANFETTLVNIKELSDILANSNGKATEILTARISEGLKEVSASIEDIKAKTTTKAKAPKAANKK